MRVLLLNYEYPPFGGSDGLACQALARGLAGRGAVVDVITSGDFDGCTREPFRGPALVEEGLLTVHRVKCRGAQIHPSGLRDVLSYLRATLPLVRQRLRGEPYDVVHLFFSPATAAMLPLLNLGDLPVVVSHRSEIPDHWAPRALTRWLWRRADRVVAVCESLGQEIRRASPHQRYTVIPDGVDLARFRPTLRRRPSSRVRCLAVARLVERKGLRELIRAIAMLERERCEVEIVGAGSDELALRQLAASLGIPDRVVFSGLPDRESLARRYREADIFTLASWEESFGDAFADALASGLPIVGSNVGGIPELVRHGQNGLLVPPRDPVALASAIRHLAEHPELRARMGRQNRADAEANLSWDRVVQRYLSTYSGVRRRTSARRPLTQIPSGTW
ncbi:MAG: glycosyltransferase family 4 protein [Gemmatimonadales bacterium]